MKPLSPPIREPINLYPSKNIYARTQANKQRQQTDEDLDLGHCDASCVVPGPDRHLLLSPLSRKAVICRSAGSVWLGWMWWRGATRVSFFLQQLLGNSTEMECRTRMVLTMRTPICGQKPVTVLTDYNDNGPDLIINSDLLAHLLTM
jgi:hypothetical protein